MEQLPRYAKWQKQGVEEYVWYVSVCVKICLNKDIF